MSDEVSLLARLFGSDVEELLGEREEILVSIIPSRFDWSYLKHFLVAGLFTLLGLGSAIYVVLSSDSTTIHAVGLSVFLFGLCWMLVIEFRRRFERYHFTDEKAIAETGMVNRDFTTVAYDTVTHIDMHQSMLQRLLDIADFELHTAGTDLSEMWINGVKQPLYLTERETLFSFLQRTTNHDEENY